MNKAKRAKLKAAGWAVASTKEFLGLTEAEAALIEMKLALSHSLRDRRQKQGLSQIQLAERLESAKTFPRHWRSQDTTASGYAGSIMKKKRSGSSAPGQRVAKSVRHIPDSQIDFSDIPESTDEELRRARRVGRPSSGMAKQLIAIRLPRVC